MVFSKNCIVYLFALSIFLVGCGQDQERPSESLTSEEQNITDHGNKILEEAKEEAVETKESVVKQSEETEAEGSDLLEKVKSQAVEIKEKTSSVIGEQFDKAKAVFHKDKEEDSITAHGDEAVTKLNQTVEEDGTKIESSEGESSSIIKKLIEKARELLDQGKYKESIDEAQKVLIHHDSESQEAMDIISKAKEKLSELVPDETSEKVEDLKENITDKLKGLGE
ncbi:MAG: hypothetical protein D8M57_10455 [Candidatus Scalindua sp. AMX11]|nr:MAG: hypothetical protein DWQ00_01590 [Candidatus Scalindua sp.]NOG85527.1 hypothetical protein [Planctomycetota bacterium]RZV90225.1 MAG: hypothetical protein EX341_06200 [Candidatus Scalindua sp. SCAELEC01]TDE65010.1 MAG: hypothetical protein D8M57_10455 [Candidatus Scalindua sp. AMX11]GJQ59555.1 MAG: hypothetical protein SCALA701_23560 [Candidatus Scalindua sp.]